MTEQEFKTTSFVYGMKVLYKGEEKEVFAVSFKDDLQITIKIPMLGTTVYHHVNFSEVELIKE
jgi:hypothetical protein